MSWFLLKTIVFKKAPGCNVAKSNISLSPLQKKEFKFNSIFFHENFLVKKTPQTSRYHLALNFEEQLN